MSNRIKPTKRETRRYRETLEHNFRNAIEVKDNLSIEYYGLDVLLNHYHEPEVFSRVFQAIMNAGLMSQVWKTLFEFRYNSLSKSGRENYRDSMRRLYLWDNDYEMAARCLPPTPQQPDEIFDAMKINLRLKRYDEAKAMVDLCREKVFWSDGRRRDDNKEWHPIFEHILGLYEQSNRQQSEEMNVRVEALEEWASSIIERWEKTHQAELVEAVGQAKSVTRIADQPN